MSIRMMTAVWDMADLTATEKLVLLKLADHSDDAGRHAYPSLAAIAQACCIHPRTVRAQLRALEQRGLIVQERPSTHNMPAMYRLTVGGIERPPRGDRPPPQGGSTILEGGSTIPRSVREPSGEPPVVARARDPEDDPPVTVSQRLWQVHEELTARLVPSTSDERQFEAWEAQGCTVQQVEMARAATVAWAPEKPWAAFKSELGGVIARARMRPAPEQPEDPSRAAIVARLRAQAEADQS